MGHVTVCHMELPKAATPTRDLPADRPPWHRVQSAAAGPSSLEGRAIAGLAAGQPAPDRPLRAPRRPPHRIPAPGLRADLRPQAPTVVKPALRDFLCSASAARAAWQLSADDPGRRTSPDSAWLRRVHRGGGLLDERGHRSRLRHVDGVAAGHLDHRRPSPLRHEAPGRRGANPVLDGDEVPARLGPPGRVGDGSAEGVHALGDLGVGHERGLLGRQVGGERAVELVAVQQQEAVLGWQDERHRGAGRGVGDQAVDRLALVGRECGEDDGRPGASNTSKSNDGISPAGVDLASSTWAETLQPLLTEKDSIMSTTPRNTVLSTAAS